MNNLIKRRIISCNSPKFNMVGNLKSILSKIDPNGIIIEIDYKYDKNLINNIKSAVRDYSIDFPNALICATVYVSTEEFPTDQYYYDEVLNHGDNRKLLPIREVLERDSKVFIDCGFININNWINYPHKIAFLYPNETGKKVYKVIQELVLETELYKMFPEYKEEEKENE